MMVTNKKKVITKDTARPEIIIQPKEITGTKLLCNSEAKPTIFAREVKKLGVTVYFTV